jgi:hypothetical protein
MRAMRAAIISIIILIAIIAMSRTNTPKLSGPVQAQSSAVEDNAKKDMIRILRGLGYNCPSVWTISNRGYVDHVGRELLVRCGPKSDTATPDQLPQFLFTVKPNGGGISVKPCLPGIC